MSRLAAFKEYAFLQALYDHGFVVPEPIDNNRHCIVMELVDGFPMVQVTEIVNSKPVYDVLMNTVVCIVFKLWLAK
jgi:RIO kinase 2